MLISLLDTRKCLKYLYCRFFTDTCNSRYIVSRISHKTFHIYYLNRRDTVFFYYILCMIFFNLRTAFFCLWNTYLDIFCSKLQKISVS